jgi:alkaline phosphatase D
MNFKYFIIFLIFISFISCSQNITKIGFGSCANQDKDQPILSLAANEKLDAFVFLGDNIYGDTDDMDGHRNLIIKN